MSVRVNLLPGENKARGQANRTRALVAAGFVVLVAGLAFLTFMQMQSIDDAEAELAAVQANNTELQARVAALEPYAELDRRFTESADVVANSLAGEVAMAGVLQDLAAVLPPQVEIDSVTVTTFDEPTTPFRGGDRVVFGSVTVTGFLDSGFSPGAEGLLLALDRVAAFDNAFATSTQADDEGVIAFTLDFQLGPEVLSGRYEPLAGGGQ